MYDIWMWLTDLGNSKMTALLIFFPLFMGMLFYVYTNKQRGKRLESYKYIPFNEDQNEIPNREGEK